MRIPQIVAKVHQENSIYKFICLCLTLTLMVMSLSMAKLALRGAVVVERANKTELLRKVSSIPTKKEIKAFLNEALEQRYNSTEKSSTLLSDREIKKRNFEREHFKRKNINQVVFVSKIDLSSKIITVSLDRLLTITPSGKKAEKIRSALGLTVSVEIKRVERTSVNPYGLIIQNSKTLNNKEGRRK